jgi:hypothetical protein
MLDEDQLKEAKKLVKLLSTKRASYFDTWYQIGKCLHDIDNRLLDDWIEFSKRTTRNNFYYGHCDVIWAKFKNSHYTMETLHYFAKMDNLDQYLEMYNNGRDKLSDDPVDLEFSHNAIAKILMEKYKFQYKCVSTRYNIWYEFKNHRWVKTDNAYTLRNIISNELVSDFSNHMTHLYNLAKSLKGYDKHMAIGRASRISKMVPKLHNVHFKNCVIRECADIAYDEIFLENLDKKPHLICFNNGVYDLELNVFREGCPEDCISLCTGYDYIVYDKNDKCSKEIKSFIKKIQPDETVRKYLLTLLSTCLNGSASGNRVPVFRGSDIDTVGISTLMELMKHTMGELSKPISIMHPYKNKISWNSLDRLMTDKKGTRFCPFELVDNYDMEGCFIKGLVGGDPKVIIDSSCKVLIHLKPQFKPFLFCDNNTLPNIMPNDYGIWQRLQILPFVNECTNFYEINEKIPEWRQMFMSMLIEYYKEYQKYGLTCPDIVVQETTYYRFICGAYKNLMEDMGKKSVDTNHFREYLTGCYNGHDTNNDNNCKLQNYGNNNCENIRNFFKNNQFEKIIDDDTQKYLLNLLSRYLSGSE